MTMADITLHSQTLQQGSLKIVYTATPTSMQVHTDGIPSPSTESMFKCPQLPQ